MGDLKKNKIKIRAYEDTGSAPVPARAVTELMDGRRRKQPRSGENAADFFYFLFFAGVYMVYIQHLNVHVYNKHQNE